VGQTGTWIRLRGPRLCRRWSFSCLSRQRKTSVCGSLDWRHALKPGGDQRLRHRARGHRRTHRAQAQGQGVSRASARRDGVRSRDPRAAGPLRLDGVPRPRRLPADRRGGGWRTGGTHRTLAGGRSRRVCSARSCGGFADVELYPDVIDRAAVLCCCLARNDPLLDGKRVACLAMLEFLARNGVEWTPALTERVDQGFAHFNVLQMQLD